MGHPNSSSLNREDEGQKEGRRELEEIFLIDDAPEIHMIFKFVLKSGPMKLTFFSNPFKALEAIKKTPPDMIICDFYMPDLIGPDLLKKIPKELLAKTCFLFLTGNDDQDEGQKLRKTKGVDGLLLKPINPKKMKNDLYVLWHQFLTRSNEKGPLIFNEGNE